jgi:hypothetical protein
MVMGRIGCPNPEERLVFKALSRQRLGSWLRASHAAPGSAQARLPVSRE